MTLNISLNVNISVFVLHFFISAAMLIVHSISVAASCCNSNYRHSLMDVKSYRYYDSATCGLDFNGVMEDIKVGLIGQ